MGWDLVVHEGALSDHDPFFPQAFGDDVSGTLARTA
jgi:hypothetical protein